MTEPLPNNTLVTVAWLAQHLSSPDVRVIDASWYLPNAQRDGKAEYAEQHIPGALFFDIDEIADTDSSLPHMLPSPEKFSSRMRKMGLGDGNRVVVYDGAGMFSAARVWWMFKVMGHEDVAVLDGGLPKWIADGHPLEDLPPPPVQERHFTARVNSMMVRDLNQMRDNIQSKDEQVLDARGAGRFSGRDVEPRAGMRAGHIPGSCNLPFINVFTDDGTMLRGEALKQKYRDAGIDLNKPIVTTCGSGVTAAVLYLGLTILGCRNLALYDGSWSEWGSHADVPVATA